MSTAFEPAEDPGWRMALRHLRSSFLPIAGPRRDTGDVNFLVTTRITFVVYAGALAQFVVVAAVLAGPLSPVGLPTTAVAAAVAAIGVLGVVAVRRLVPMLDCSSDGALLGSYRSRFFLQLGCSALAAVFGFVGSLLTAAPAVYLVGAAWAAVGGTILAPSARNLARDQERLIASGCPHNLTALLCSARQAPE